MDDKSEDSFQEPDLEDPPAPPYNEGEVDIGVEERPEPLRPVPLPLPGSQVEGLIDDTYHRIHTDRTLSRCRRAWLMIYWFRLVVWKGILFFLDPLRTIATVMFALAYSFTQLARGMRPIEAFYIGCVLSCILAFFLWASGVVTKVLTYETENVGVGWYRDWGKCQTLYVLMNLFFISLSIGMTTALGVRCKDLPPEECMEGLPYINGTWGAG